MIRQIVLFMTLCLLSFAACLKSEAPESPPSIPDPLSDVLVNPDGVPCVPSSSDISPDTEAPNTVLILPEKPVTANPDTTTSSVKLLERQSLLDTSSVKPNPDVALLEHQKSSRRYTSSEGNSNPDTTPSNGTLLELQSLIKPSNGTLLELSLNQDISTSSVRLEHQKSPQKSPEVAPNLPRS